MKTTITEMQESNANDHHSMFSWLGDFLYNKSDIYACFNAKSFQVANARRTAETREKLFALLG